MRIYDKQNNRKKHSGPNGSSVNNAAESRSLSIPPCFVLSLKHELSWKLCRYGINIRCLHCSLIIDSTSITTFGDVAFCWFFLAVNYLMAQCPTIPPQIRAKLVNMCEASSPTLPRQRQGFLSNRYPGRSPQRGGNSTPNILQSATTANNQWPLERGACWWIKHLLMGPWRNQRQKPRSKGQTDDNHCIDTQSPWRRRIRSSPKQVVNWSPTHGMGVTTAQASINITDWTDTSENEQLRALPPGGTVCNERTVLWWSIPRCVIFRPVTYCVPIFVGILSNDVLIASSPVYTCAALNLMNWDFRPPGWRWCMKTPKPSWLHTASRKVVSVEGIISIFPHWWRMRERLVWSCGESCLWSATWDIVHRSLFLGNVHVWVKSVLWNSRPVPIILVRKPFNAGAVGAEVFDRHKITHSGTPTEEHHLCCIACQFMIPCLSRAAVMVIFCDTGPMTTSKCCCVPIFHERTRPHGLPTLQAALSLYCNPAVNDCELEEIYDYRVSVSCDSTNLVHADR